ncbi:MAG: hypothetical protein KDK27_04010 [Leptospiraceae bacterium]|nr:hypothetical protein [Leptospiraceae bacterium]
MTDRIREFASLLRQIRHFFQSERDYLEVESRLLRSTGSFEAHLDSFSVIRSGVRKSPLGIKSQSGDRAGYLITSPEYGLKAALAGLRSSCFQIAHCFREGDQGDWHREEFLMLEWYRVQADEFDLMRECFDLLQALSPNRSLIMRKSSVRELLQRHVGIGDWEPETLAQVVRSMGSQLADTPETEYDDLFFFVFLNKVEAHLGKDGPEFVYHYPPALSALSRVQNGVARRFELYWKGVELANGYYELRNADDYIRRCAEENSRRRRLGKTEMDLDPEMLGALRKAEQEHGSGLPECSGIALGLDRLFMVLADTPNLGLADCMP